MDLIWLKKRNLPRTPKCVLFCIHFSLHYSSELILQHLPKWSCSNSLAQILLWIIYYTLFQRAEQKSQLFLVLTVSRVSSACRYTLQLLVLLWRAAVEMALASRWCHYSAIGMWTTGSVCYRAGVLSCFHKYITISVFSESRLRCPWRFTDACAVRAHAFWMCILHLRVYIQIAHAGTRHVNMFKIVQPAGANKHLSELLSLHPFF